MYKTHDEVDLVLSRTLTALKPLLCERQALMPVQSVLRNFVKWATLSKPILTHPSTADELKIGVALVNLKLGLQAYSHLLKIKPTPAGK